VTSKLSPVLLFVLIASVACASPVAKDEPAKDEPAKEEPAKNDAPKSQAKKLPAGLLDPKEADYFPQRGACYSLGKDYFLTGQLAQPDYEFAKENGVKSVILVRMERELGGLGFDQAAAIQALGMNFEHIPIGPELMKTELANKFVESVAKAQKPLMIVGSNGNRVWGLWSLYLGQQFGVPVDQTKAVATKVGIKRLVIEDFARKHLASGGGKKSSDGAKAPTKKEKMPAALLQPVEADYFPQRGACYGLGKNYFLTGQLAQPDYEFAKENGVKSVLLVRMDRELGGLGFDQATAIKGLGMNFEHIPVGPELMKKEFADKFVESVTKAPKPLMIVGSNGNRVWGLWSLYLGRRYGTPVDQTKAVATKVGIKKLVIEDFVRKHLGQ